MSDPRAVPPDGGQLWRRLAGLVRQAGPLPPVEAAPPADFVERVLAGRVRPAIADEDSRGGFEDWLAIRAALAAVLVAAVVVGWNVDVLRPGPGSPPLALDEFIDLEPMP